MNFPPEKTHERKKMKTEIETVSCPHCGCDKDKAKKRTTELERALADACLQISVAHGDAEAENKKLREQLRDARLS